MPDKVKADRSAWTSHVKKYAKEHNIPYMCAVSGAKTSYT